MRKSNFMRARAPLVPVVAIVLVFCTTVTAAPTLFPTSLPGKEWIHFDAAGFSKAACGVVYRTGDSVTNGMALGGIDTGCLDLDPSGLLGYSTIFNSHVPRRGPINEPILGLSVGGKTWVLCKPDVRAPSYVGVGPKGPAEPVRTELVLDGVETAEEIHYWGHYPVVDMEFDTSAPVGVGLRAWSPFLPGDVLNSMVPAAVFEVHLRNHTDTPQRGKLAFSFPGPSHREAGCDTFVHRPLEGQLQGVQVQGRTSSYALAVLTPVKTVSVGGELGPNGAAWARIHESLPELNASKAAASLAVDFSLKATETKVVRFVLTWSSPKWSGDGSPSVEPKAPVTESWICPSGRWDQKADHIADMIYTEHNRANPATYEKIFDVHRGQRISLYLGAKVGHETGIAGAEMTVEALSVAEQDPGGSVNPGDVWDLKRDWSLESNPHGQWEIGNCDGGGMGKPYHLVDDWQPNSIAGSTLQKQAAWAPSRLTGAAKLVNDRPFKGDSRIGDIVVHPWTSLRWISPITGKVKVSARSWMIRAGKAGGTIYTHMYAKHYPDAPSTVEYLKKHHESLLKRTLAWQEVVYTDNALPIWLRDSLINILYCLTETSFWAQKTPTMPDWVKPADGLFGLNECPRACPQMECLPCSFYGSLPLAYFFPELQLSTIRAYKAFQAPDGCPPWIFGSQVTLTSPNWNQYQASTNGISLAGIVDRFLICRDTEDKKYTREFYPMIKKAMEYTIFTGADSNPEYSVGEQVISMPLKYGNKEWFEADFPGWLGCVAHVGLLHLAQARITERMAREMGDHAYARKCAEWVRLGAEAMENRLWDERGYYWNFFDPVEGTKSDFVFGYQMDGEWITDHHGLPSALPEPRVRTTLETIKRTNIALSRSAATNYARADGTPVRKAKKGTWDYGRFSYFPPEAFMLAMNYMYEGQVAYGIELARRMWQNVVCLQGYTWDVPNIMRGDADTGERVFGNDYYQDMIIWSLPAAIQQKDVSAPCKPGGLVDRILRAAKG